MHAEATPEEAKRLWEAAEAAGDKPSLRSIAKQLGVAQTTVMRWKRDGWTRPDLPVITGCPASPCRRSPRRSTRAATRSM